MIISLLTPLEYEAFHDLIYHDAPVILVWKDRHPKRDYVLPFVGYAGKELVN